MREDKWKKRDKARHKREHGTVVGSRSVFTIIQAQIKRAGKNKKRGKDGR